MGSVGPFSSFMCVEFPCFDAAVVVSFSILAVAVAVALAPPRLLRFNEEDVVSSKCGNNF